MSKAKVYILHVDDYNSNLQLQDLVRQGLVSFVKSANYVAIGRFNTNKKTLQKEIMKQIKADQ